VSHTHIHPAPHVSPPHIHNTHAPALSPLSHLPHSLELEQRKKREGEEVEEEKGRGGAPTPIGGRCRWAPQFAGVRGERPPQASSSSSSSHGGPKPVSLLEQAKVELLQVEDPHDMVSKPQPFSPFLPIPSKLPSPQHSAWWWIKKSRWKREEWGEYLQRWMNTLA
jgi:hypothetical protein